MDVRMAAPVSSAEVSMARTVKGRVRERDAEKSLWMVVRIDYTAGRCKREVLSKRYSVEPGPGAHAQPSSTLVVTRVVRRVRRQTSNSSHSPLSANK